MQLNRFILLLWSKYLIAELSEKNYFIRHSWKKYLEENENL